MERMLPPTMAFCVSTSSAKQPSTTGALAIAKMDITAARMDGGKPQRRPACHSLTKGTFSKASIQSIMAVATASRSGSSERGSTASCAANASHAAHSPPRPRVVRSQLRGCSRRQR
eukprot:6706616-Pyramimonas_sp.AAC.1